MVAGDDVLKISVQFVEDTNKSIEELVKRVQLVLDKDFKLKVSDSDALQTLKTISSTLDEIKSKMGNLSSAKPIQLVDTAPTKEAVHDVEGLKQAVQQLGQKYKHTAEQSRELMELISGDKFNKSQVQRKLKVGFNQATDIVETINALQKLHQVEQQQTPKQDLGNTAEKLQMYQQLLEVLTKLQQKLTEISTSLKGEVWGNLTKGVQDSIVVFNRLADELSRLDTKFAKTMGRAMGTAYAKQMMKNAEDAKAAGDAAKKASEEEQQLGNALTTVSQKAMAAAESMSRMKFESSRANGAGMLEDIHSMNQAYSMMADVRKKIIDITSTMDASKKLGFDTGELKVMLDYYRQLYGYLQLIYSGHGYAYIQGYGIANTRDVKENALYEGNNKIYEQEIKSIQTINNETDRLLKLRSQLTSISQGTFNKDKSAEILAMAAAVDEYLNKIRQLPRVEAAALFNEAYKKQIGGYEKTTNMYANEEKVVAEGRAKAEKSIADLETQINLLRGLTAKAGVIDNFDQGQIDKINGLIERLKVVKDYLESIKSSGKGVDAYVSSPMFAANFQQSRQAYDTMQSAIREQLEKNRKSRQLTKEEEKANAERAKSQNEASIRVIKLINQYRELKRLSDKAIALGINTRDIDQAKAKIRQLGEEIWNIRKGGSKQLFSEYWNSSSTYQKRDDIDLLKQRATQQIKDAEKALRDNERAKAKNAGSTNKLTVEEQKLANAMKQTSQSASAQNQILGDLRSMAMQYLSVWGASSFVQSMAQITGELELQQKSLEVIIGSASYASQLFGEIRDLSQQSPYTFQDLLKSTRQLAAFGVETKDIYDTMKALSDIGAGLSVDVQRLILAYGHTKSYGYLSGIQNRQFETAGIDMIGGLVDRYNKLADAERAAGRAAEYVTRKDVFKRMSKRDISFEDVSAVIMGLDQPGGKFYNMQERQFETLGGKLRNLRNNYNIMMAEMGKDNHGVLMGGVNILNELTGNWDKYAHAISAILIPLGLFKVATIAVNSALGVQTNQMAKNATALVQNQRATQAAIAAMQGGYWGAIKGGWNANRTFTPTGKDAGQFKRMLQAGFDRGDISKSQLMMMGTSGDLPKQFREIALSIAGVERNMLKAMAASSGWTRLNYRLKYSLSMAAGAVRAFGAAMASMAVQLAPMAIFGGIIALYSHFKSMSDETKQTLDELAEHAKQDAKSISDVIASYSERGIKQAGLTTYLSGERITERGLSFDMKEISKMTASDIEDMKSQLQKYSPFYEGDLVDIDKMESQADKVMTIMRKLDSYRHTEEVLAATAGKHDEAASSHFGWFFGIGSYESFTENLKDMDKAFRLVRGQVDGLSDEQIDEYDKAMGNALSRAVESGAAVDKAEALKQKLIQSLSLSWSDNRAMIKSWKNKGLEDLFGRYQVIGRNIHTASGFGAGYMGDFKKSVERLAPSLRNTIEQSFSSDDIDGALKYAIEQYEAFAAQAKGVSEEAKQYGLNMLLQSVFGESGQFGSGYKDFLNKQFAGEVNSEIERAGNVNVFMTPQEIQANVMSVVENMKEQWKAAGKDIRQISNSTIADIVKAILNDNRLEEAWKKRFAFSTQDGAQVASDFGKLYHKEIKESGDYYSFWFDTIKKKYDEQTKELKNMFVPLKQKWNIEIDPNITFKTEDIDKLKKIRDKVKQMVEGEPWSAERKEELKPILETLNAQITLQEMMKQEGIEFAKDKNNNGAGRGHAKDREYELWEQRVKIIQEARREYDYWEKAVGKESAQEKVKKNFEDLISKDSEIKKALKPGDLDDLENYRKVLEEVNKLALEREAKLSKTPESKWSDLQKLQHNNNLKLLRDIGKTINDINKMEFEKSTERFVSGMARALEDLTRRWEIFNSVRGKVGNDDLAMRLAGFTGNDNGAIFKSDAIKTELEAYMKKNASGVGAIDFAKVLGLDEKGIEDMVKNLFRGVTDGLYEKLISGTATDAEKDILAGYEEQIKAVINALKEWQKAEKETSKDAVLAYSEVLNKAVDYQSQVNRINAESQEQIDKINKSTGSRQSKNQAISRVNAEAESKKWQLSAEYANLMNRALSLTRAEIENGINAAVDDLNRKMQNNLITATEYAEQMQKLHKTERDAGMSRGLLGTYAKGGMSGVVAKNNDAVTNLQALYNQQLASGNYYAAIKTSTALEKAIAKRNKSENREEALQRFVAATNVATNAINSLQQAAQSLSDMFDALGNEKMANKFSDIAQGIGGIGEAFSGISSIASSALSGDIGGIVSNAILAPIKLFTGPITAFAKLYDQKRERRIEAIGKELTRIGNTLDLIKSLREQELGYASGSNIRAFASLYQSSALQGINNIKSLYKAQGPYGKGYLNALKSNAVNEGMAEYYSRALANDAESSYAMEYNMLLDQRKKKMEQYNEEANKKKSDATKLEAYKKEIAELDAQVKQFAKDLMKELWGIDFKAWASQISDALMTAFENGTSSAKAFKNTMSDIMRSVAKNMLNLAIIEPFLQHLQDILMDEETGIINKNNKADFINHPERYTGKMIEAVGLWYESEGQSMLNASQAFYNGVEDLLKQYGIDLDSKNKDSGSNSITQQITEESAGYLTGVLAAMHQDVSVMRLMKQTLVAEQMPKIIEAMTVSGSNIAGIDENTRAIMQMMQSGSGRMYERIDYIGNKLDRFASGFDRITVA